MDQYVVFEYTFCFFSKFPLIYLVKKWEGGQKFMEMVTVSDVKD